MLATGFQEFTMRTNRPVLCADHWIIPDTESVDALIDVVLTEQAWWIAARCGKHAQCGVIWADGTGRPNPRRRAKLSSFSMAGMVAEEWK
jgi:hypothetical protein